MKEVLPFSPLGELILFFVGSLVFCILTLIAAKLIRPNRPNQEKNTVYESGEDPVGNAWGNFNMRFYIIAIMFLLFEVEIAFLFPWATVFGNEELIKESDGVWGYFSIVEMFVFIFLLTLGLMYAWGKGYLDWVKPNTKVKETVTKVPIDLYDQINKKF